MNRILFIVTLLLTASAACAGTNGGLGGAFDRMGAGARAKALGNAYVAVPEGPSTIYFNPGATPFTEQSEFTAMDASMALDRSLQYLAFVTPVRPKAAEGQVVNAGIGVAWLHAGVGDIDSRDFDGLPLEMIDMSSNVFMLGFGVQFHERFGGGVTAKVIYETFGKITDNDRSVNGDGFGADVGLYAIPLDFLSLGAQVKDIGTKTTWNTTDYWSQGSSKADDWPLQYRFGAAYHRQGLLGAVDIETSEEGEAKLHAGAEISREITEKQSVAARTGYDDGAFCVGFGIGFAFWKVLSTVDFTYTFEDIAPGDTPTVSWSVKF